ncbi:MAG: RNA-binding protein [Pseudomonadota bacterium]
MTRGGRKARPDEPERRCVATGERTPQRGLIRFVLAPDGTQVVPDVAGKLPGRGAWLSAERAAADRAEKKRLFSRAFKRPVETPAGLSDLLETLLAQRLIDTVSLARKAGAAVTGYEKVRARLDSGTGGALLTASDAGADGRSKAAKMAGNTPRIAVLTATELGLAFGREFAIHAALDAGGIATRALADADRLGGFRAGPGQAGTAQAAPLGMADGPAADDDEPGVGPGATPKVASDRMMNERDE